MTLGVHIVIYLIYNFGSTYDNTINTRAYGIPSGSRCIIHTRDAVLTRTEWILASTGEAGATLNRHRVGVSLYSPPAVHTARPACYLTQPSKHEALNQCWIDARPVSQTVGQHWTSIGSTSCLQGVLTSHIVFRTSPWLKTEK